MEKQQGAFIAGNQSQGNLGKNQCVSMATSAVAYAYIVNGTPLDKWNADDIAYMLFVGDYNYKETISKAKKQIGEYLMFSDITSLTFVQNVKEKSQGLWITTNPYFTIADHDREEANIIVSKLNRKVPSQYKNSLYAFVNLYLSLTAVLKSEYTSGAVFIINGYAYSVIKGNGTDLYMFDSHGNAIFDEQSKKTTMVALLMYAEDVVDLMRLIINRQSKGFTDFDCQGIHFEDTKSGDFNATDDSKEHVRQNVSYARQKYAIEDLAVQFFNLEDRREAIQTISEGLLATVGDLNSPMSVDTTTVIIDDADEDTDMKKENNKEQSLENIGEIQKPQRYYDSITTFEITDDINKEYVSSMRIDQDIQFQEEQHEQDSNIISDSLITVPIEALNAENENSNNEDDDNDNETSLDAPVKKKNSSSPPNPTNYSNTKTKNNKRKRSGKSKSRDKSPVVIDWSMSSDLKTMNKKSNSQSKEHDIISIDPNNTQVIMIKKSDIKEDGAVMNEHPWLVSALLSWNNKELVNRVHEFWFQDGDYRYDKLISPARHQRPGKRAETVSQTVDVIPLLQKHGFEVAEPKTNEEQNARLTSMKVPETAKDINTLFTVPRATDYNASREAIRKAVTNAVVDFAINNYSMKDRINIFVRQWSDITSVSLDRKLLYTQLFKNFKINISSDAGFKKYSGKKKEWSYMGPIGDMIKNQQLRKLLEDEFEKEEKVLNTVVVSDDTFKEIDSSSDEETFDATSGDDNSPNNLHNTPVNNVTATLDDPNGTPVNYATAETSEDSLAPDNEVETPDSGVKAFITDENRTQSDNQPKTPDNISTVTNSDDNLTPRDLTRTPEPVYNLEIDATVASIQDGNGFHQVHNDNTQKKDNDNDEEIMEFDPQELNNAIKSILRGSEDEEYSEIVTIDQRPIIINSRERDEEYIQTDELEQVVMVDKTAEAPYNGLLSMPVSSATEMNDAQQQNDDDVSITSPIKNLNINKGSPLVPGDNENGYQLTFSESQDSQSFDADQKLTMINEIIVKNTSVGGNDWINSVFPGDFNIDENQQLKMTYDINPDAMETTDTTQITTQTTQETSNLSTEPLTIQLSDNSSPVPDTVKTESNASTPSASASLTTNQQPNDTADATDAAAATTDGSNDDSEKEKCAICLEDLDALVTTTIECEHVFHKRCIDFWFLSDKNTCLLCRQVQKNIIRRNVPHNNNDDTEELLQRANALVLANERYIEETENIRRRGEDRRNRTDIILRETNELVARHQENMRRLFSEINIIEERIRRHEMEREQASTSRQDQSETHTSATSDTGIFAATTNNESSTTTSTTTTTTTSVTPDTSATLYNVNVNNADTKTETSDTVTKEAEISQTISNVSNTTIVLDDTNGDVNMQEGTTFDIDNYIDWKEELPSDIVTKEAKTPQPMPDALQPVVLSDDENEGDGVVTHTLSDLLIEKQTETPVIDTSESMLSSHDDKNNTVSDTDIKENTKTPVTTSKERHWTDTFTTLSSTTTSTTTTSSSTTTIFNQVEPPLTNSTTSTISITTVSPTVTTTTNTTGTTPIPTTANATPTPITFSTSNDDDDNSSKPKLGLDVTKKNKRELPPDTADNKKKKGPKSFTQKQDGKTKTKRSNSFASSAPKRKKNGKIVPSDDENDKSLGQSDSPSKKSLEKGEAKNDSKKQPMAVDDDHAMAVDDDDKSLVKPVDKKDSKTIESKNDSKTTSMSKSEDDKIGLPSPHDNDKKDNKTQQGEPMDIGNDDVNTTKSPSPIVKTDNKKSQAKKTSDKPPTLEATNKDKVPDKKKAPESKKTTQTTAAKSAKKPVTSTDKLPVNVQKADVVDKNMGAADRSFFATIAGQSDKTPVDNTSSERLSTSNATQTQEPQQTPTRTINMQRKSHSQNKEATARRQQQTQMGRQSKPPQPQQGVINPEKQSYTYEIPPSFNFGDSKKATTSPFPSAAPDDWSRILDERDLTGMFEDGPQPQKSPIQKAKTGQQQPTSTDRRSTSLQPQPNNHGMGTMRQQQQTQPSPQSTNQSMFPQRQLNTRDQEEEVLIHRSANADYKRQTERSTAVPQHCSDGISFDSLLPLVDSHSSNSEESIEAHNDKDVDCYDVLSMLRQLKFDLLAFEKTDIAEGIHCAKKDNGETELEFQEKVLNLIEKIQSMELDKLKVLDKQIEVTKLNKESKDKSEERKFRLQQLEKQNEHQLKLARLKLLTSSRHSGNDDDESDGFYDDLCNMWESANDLAERKDVFSMMTSHKKQKHDSKLDTIKASLEKQRADYERERDSVSKKLFFSFTETNGTEFIDTSDPCEFQKRQRFEELWEMETSEKVNEDNSTDTTALTALDELISLSRSVVKNHYEFNNYAKSLKKEKSYNNMKGVSVLQMRLRLCREMGRGEIKLFQTGSRYTYNFYKCEECSSFQFRDSDPQMTISSRYLTHRDDDGTYITDMWEFLSTRNRFPACMIYAESPKRMKKIVMNRNRQFFKLNNALPIDNGPEKVVYTVTLSTGRFAVQNDDSSVWFNFGPKQPSSQLTATASSSKNKGKTKDVGAINNSNSECVINVNIFDAGQLGILRNWHSISNSLTNEIKERFQMHIIKSARQSSNCWRIQYLNFICYLADSLTFSFGQGGTSFILKLAQRYYTEINRNWKISFTEWRLLVNAIAVHNKTIHPEVRKLVKFLCVD